MVTPVFCALILQEGSRIRGLTIEYPKATADSEGYVSDLVGRVYESGAIRFLKTYRDRPDVHAVEYRGQVSTDIRAIGGSWEVRERNQAGTFVLRRATLGLSAHQW